VETLQSRFYNYICDACFQFIFVSFILSVAWIAIVCVMMVPVLMYVSISAICDNEIYSHTAQELTDMNYCFNLTRFGRWAILEM